MRRAPRRTLGANIVLLAVVAGAASGQSAALEDTLRLERALARHLFQQLPADERTKIRTALAGAPADPPASLETLAGPGGLDRFDDATVRFLRYRYERSLEGPLEFAACLAPGSDPELIRLIDAIEQQNVERFLITARWSTTALQPGPLPQGTPTVITYSFVPDGTPILDQIDVPPSGIPITEPSNLFAWLDGIYGSTAVWQELFARVFARWSALCGTTYVFEPNDDGRQISLLAPGVEGVRGDVRIGAIGLDGSLRELPDGTTVGGTLAFNFFPDLGDMVFDSADDFFDDISGDSLGLRNTIAHEHGHGLGLLHVCPLTQTKLMEPFVSRQFDGPQLDDILATQRSYGDPLEPNDTQNEATSLGLLSPGAAISLNNLSIDDDLDLDVFSFRLPAFSAARVTVTPDAAAFLSGPQLGDLSCSAGVLVDYNAISDLRLNEFDAGVPIDGTPAGGAEAFTLVNAEPSEAAVSFSVSGVPVAGPEVQRYRLDIEPSDDLGEPIAAFDRPDFGNAAGGLPLTVAVELTPSVPTVDSFQVTIFWRDDPDTPFTPVAVIAGAGDRFDAALGSLDCESVIEYYAEIEYAGDVGGRPVSGTVSLPAGGASSPATVVVGDRTDDFEAERGWSVQTTAVEGGWTRGVPVAFDRGDPPADFDGSGSAFLTENDPSDSNSDVDAGETRLISPRLDTRGGGQLRYAYWLGRPENILDANNNPIPVAPFSPGDGLFVDLSLDDGQTWQRLREYRSELDAWRTDSIDIAPAGGTRRTRVRFVAADVEGGPLSETPTILEAGIDAFEFDSVGCDATPICAADIVLPYGVLSQSDVDEFTRQFFSGGAGADLAPPFGLLSQADVGAFVQLFFSPACMPPG